MQRSMGRRSFGVDVFGHGDPEPPVVGFYIEHISKWDGLVANGSMSLYEMHPFGNISGYGSDDTVNDISPTCRIGGPWVNAMGVIVSQDGTLTVRLVTDVGPTGRKLFRTMKVYTGRINYMEFDAIQRSGTTPDFYTTEGSMVILT